MKSQDTPFEGGPMDGRVLPVLLGPTGHPPKTYRIPVPDPDGGPPTVLVYRREPRGHSRRLGLVQGWKYRYDPDDTTGGRLRWPWSRPAAPAAPPPDAPRSGKPGDTNG
ncbi:MULTISPECIES: hypothetical protein [Streptomyces]|uniref:YD repeat-containing protein n=1 Tax=Streptomyces eurythermus TaxID=42237 RepID=A0ABW6Z4J2_9ACTN|nr:MULTISPECIES: hypothetical protein [Streptomyces]QIS73152.1 hypothetical protein HB370_26860 [Streptomyces sp. DSM 40868]WDM14753.1 hypothetical protein J3S85_26530 [Streptomyces lavenduligriseus]